MLAFLSFLDVTSRSYTKDSVRLYKHAYVALRNAVNAYMLLGALLALKETIKPTNLKLSRLLIDSYERRLNNYVILILQLGRRYLVKQRMRTLLI